MVRFKNRYFLCEIVEQIPTLSMQALTTQILQKEIKENVSLNFGDMGLGQIAFSFQVKLFIIRVSRDYKNIIWTTIMMMTQLNGISVAIKILQCSGTVKRIEIKAKKILQKWLHRIMKNKDINSKVKEILQTEQYINIEH